MAVEDGAATVRTLAQAFGWSVRPEHLAETAAAWALTAPHLQRVNAVVLEAEVEPASLFRP